MRFAFYRARAGDQTQFASNKRGFVFTKQISRLDSSRAQCPQHTTPRWDQNVSVGGPRRIPTKHLNRKKLPRPTTRPVAHILASAATVT